MVTSTISKLDQDLSSARTDSAQTKQEINKKTEKIKELKSDFAELTETCLKRLNTEIRSLTA